jgi:hypothetical protein
MDEVPLSLPLTWFEFLQQTADAIKQQRRQGRAVGLGPPFQRLVRDDELYFRVLARPAEAWMTPEQTKARTAQARAAADVFRGAFADVWGHVVPPDRQALHDFWRTAPRWASYAQSHLASAYPRPLIQIVGPDPAGPVPRIFAVWHELTFPFDLVVQRADRLPAEIAHKLAETHRFATGRFWEVGNRMVDDPMERWERRQGKQLTEAAAAAKWRQLVKAYLPVHKADIAQILERWGLAPRQRSSRRPRGQRANREV